MKNVPKTRNEISRNIQSKIVHQQPFVLFLQLFMYEGEFLRYLIQFKVNRADIHMGYRQRSTDDSYNDEIRAVLFLILIEICDEIWRVVMLNFVLREISLRFTLNCEEQRALIP